MHLSKEGLQHRGNFSPRALVEHLLVLALASSPLACERGNESDVEDKPVSADEEYRGLEGTIREAREGGITPEEILDEIDVQIAMGNVSEFMAEQLRVMVEKAIEKDQQEKIIDDTPYDAIGPSVFGDYINLSAISSTPGIMALHLLKSNLEIQGRMKDQFARGILSPSQVGLIQTHTLIAQGPEDLKITRLSGTRDAARTPEERLENANFALRMNEAKHRMMKRQLAAGEIDQSVYDLLSSDHKSAEDPGFRAFRQLELNEVDHWVETGLIDENTAEFMKADEKSHRWLHLFLFWQEDMEKAKAEGDERKIAELEKRKERLIRNANDPRHRILRMFR